MPTFLFNTYMFVRLYSWLFIAEPYSLFKQTCSQVSLVAANVHFFKLNAKIFHQNRNDGKISKRIEAILKECTFQRNGFKLMYTRKAILYFRRKLCKNTSTTLKILISRNQLLRCDHILTKCRWVEKFLLFEKDQWLWDMVVKTWKYIEDFQVFFRTTTSVLELNLNEC